ncbi:unnamed protein product, partial [Brenthis ino]
MGRKRKSTRRMRESDDSEHSESGSLVRRRHKSRRRYNKSQTRDSSSGSDVPRHCRVSKKRRKSRRYSETPQRRTVPRGHNGTPDPGTTQRRNVSRGRDVTRDPGTPPRRDVLRNHEEYQNPEELQSTHLLQNEYAAGTSQPATIPAVTPTVSAPQINVSTDFNANVLALAFKELIQTMKTDGEPDKLLVYLRNVRLTRKPEKPSPSMQAGNNENKQSRSFKSNQNTSDVKNNRSYRLTKCYNCKEEGHPYFLCKKPIIRCESCHRIGHVSNNCPGKTDSKANESNSKTVLRISKQQDNESKYFKVAKVNGQNLDCYVDFGSQCTMLRESFARNFVSTWSVSELPVIRGFGDSIVNCLGKFVVELEIDSVKASVEVLIVPDHLLQVPLLVGQTFTEQEHIVVYKNKNQLKISTYPTTSVQLYVKNSVTVKGFTVLDVYSKPDYTGDLFIEPSLCQDPQNPYEISQSIIRVTNSHGNIVIKGLDPEFVLTKDMLLLRALPLTELKFESLNVSKIEHCPDNNNIFRIEAETIQVDNSIGPDNPDNLWDECVSEIQWGLNNTQNKGTGKSPAQALFGLDLVGTSGSLLQLSVTDSADNVDTPIEDIRREMTEQIRDNQDKQKQRFDKIRKEVTYNIGDLVRIEREISSTGNSRKLIPKLRGPYRIKEVLDNDRYVVEDTPLSRKGNRNFSSIFSVDKIHPWMVFNRADTESETSNNDDADELEVR